MKVRQLKTVVRPLCLLLALTGILSSCITDRNEDMPDGNITGEETSVRVSLQMPAAAPNTYAISDIDENAVKTVDVFAFKAVATDAQHPSGWAYAYKVKGSAIADATTNDAIKSKKQFTVMLIKNRDPQRFVVLANVRDEVDALGDIAVGADKDALLARLQASNVSNWNANNDDSKPQDDPNRFRNFPMWGEVTATLIDGVTEITGVGMLRNIARLDVVLGDDVIAANNFQLNELYIYNSKNKGYIVPAPANISSTKATAATVPADATDYAAWNNATPLKYTIPAAMKTAFERTAYLFEAKAVAQDKASNATCIVVGGTYGTDTKISYYRLDFLLADGKTYKDVLRNHQYRANIIKVEGRGYPTPEDAFNSASLNILAEIIEWDDGGMGNVVFDGQYALSVSQDNYSFFRDACTVEESDNVLYVQTNYKTTSGVNSGWYIDRIVDATDKTTPVSWLTLTPNTGAVDNKTKVVLTYEENNSGKSRSAIVWIAAGRLRFPVTVIQKTEPRIMLEIVDPTTNLPLTSLLFAAQQNVVPATQSFRVNWAPKNAGLAILNTAVGSTAFNSSSGIPSTTTIYGSGTMQYNIRPAALTNAEITANPFIEKISKVDFTVTNGVSYATKSIILRQLCPNLIVQAADNYLADGTQYTIYAKSNTSWRIKSIEDKTTSSSGSGILALQSTDNLKVGTTGDYNITTGTPLTFTVANDRSCWGLLNITFESTDDAKRFDDKVVTLMFALPKVSIVGFSQESTYGYAPTVTAGAAYRMLTSTDNFGLQTNSKVYSRGFDLTHNTNANNLQTILGGKPQIVAIGFSQAISAGDAAMYLDYLKSGGVMVVLCQDVGSVQNLINVVFSSSSTALSRNAAGAVYKIANNINDPITNGPFGDLRNFQWGEDASSTCAISNIPANDVVVYSNAFDVSGTSTGFTSEVTVFKHNRYKLFWIGDGGFTSTSTGTEIAICPFRLNTSTQYPIPKPNYGRGSQYSVYNSQMYANIITWAITQTQP